MKLWRIWYLERQVKLTVHAARHWDVWVCGRCGRAVPGNRIVLCLCATKGFRDAHPSENR